MRHACLPCSRIGEPVTRGANCGRCLSVRQRLPRRSCTAMPTRDRVGSAVDDVAHHAHALGEVDERDDVRQVARVATRAGQVVHGDGVHDVPSPDAGAPLELGAEAARAHVARVPDRRVARRRTTAARTRARASPPRTARPSSETGGSNDLRHCRRLRAEHDRAHRRQHTARAVRDRDLRIRRAAARRTRRAAGAPPRRAGTCRTGPGACTRGRRRSCSSAATRPGPSLPSSTNAPPSPFAQKPRSSRCSSAVIVNES